jgi:hypothetical protein
VSPVAVPTILIDSATGSDSAASGAGPSTALTGTAGATNGGGTIVTLDAGTVLTGVATDGSHVIYFIDTTAGDRRFASISATSGSGGATPTVTVNEALTGSLSGIAWAIGGKRASLGSATSRLLVNNNGSSGDAMPGWTMQFQSGHTETTTRFDLHRAGDTTTGPITIEGIAGAVVKPLLTFTDDDRSFVNNAASWQLRNFSAKNSHGSPGTGCSFAFVNSTPFILDGLTIGTVSDVYYAGIVTGGAVYLIRNCEVGWCSGGDGIDAGVSDPQIENCYCHDNAGHGINANGGVIALNVVNNICARNGGDGILITGGTDFSRRTYRVTANTCDSNTGHGIEFDGLMTSFNAMDYLNNILSNNGGWGLKFHASQTLPELQANGARGDNNDTFNNTSGPCSVTGFLLNDPGLDPQFTNAAAGDFTIGTNLAAKGYPSLVGGSQ